MSVLSMSDVHLPSFIWTQAGQKKTKFQTKQTKKLNKIVTRTDLKEVFHYKTVKSESSPEVYSKEPNVSAPPHWCWAGNAARFSRYYRLLH